jgi:hypothetical protein
MSGGIKEVGARLVEGEKQKYWPHWNWRRGDREKGQCAEKRKAQDDDQGACAGSEAFLSHLRQRRTYQNRNNMKQTSRSG